MKFYFFLFLGSISFDIGDQRKIISDDNHNYEFYVSSDKIPNYKTDRSYFWYKSHEVHSSIGFSNGELLNGSYIKSSRDNNIIAQDILIRDSVAFPKNVALPYPPHQAHIANLISRI